VGVSIYSDEFKEGAIKQVVDGGHADLTKEGLPVNLSVPQHKELGIGILRSLIKHAGLTVDEFRDLLP